MNNPVKRQSGAQTSAANAGESRGPDLLERQLAVIERVAQSPAGLPFSAIQRSLGLPKATTHRLVHSLCAVGLLQTVGDAARIYRVGARLIKLLGLVVSPDRLIPLARPVLTELVEAFGETAFIAMLNAEEIETITMVTPVKEWEGHVHPGRIMPAHAAASAKAIMAFQAETVWETVLRLPLQAFTTKTIVDPVAIKREYQQIRKRGFATCVAEIDLGQTAVAAPIRVGELGVILSVCIAGPTHRIRKHSISKLADSLIEAACILEKLFVRSMEHTEALPGVLG